jgi:hypothetical protein
MTAARPLLAPALLALLAACQGTAHVVDQRPDHVPAEQLSSVRWVSLENEAGKRSGGSAIVVGPRHLVTNAHVWSDATPWCEAELPSGRELTLFDRGASLTLGLAGGVTTMKSPKWFVPREFRLVASGASTLELGPDGEYTNTSLLHGDWVLVETDEPTWGEGDLAHVHPPALDPDWRVPNGTELFVLGFSTIFDPTLHASSPVAQEDMATFLRDGPYTLVGEAVSFDGQTTLAYTPGWPQPKGHSGGGVYLWNEAAERLELVGVFHSWNSVTTTRSAEIAPLGISALSFERVSKVRRRHLYYAPIADALQALSSGSD